MTAKVTSIDNRLTFWQDFAKDIKEGKIEEAVVVYVRDDGGGCYATLGEEPNEPLLMSLMAKVILKMLDEFGEDSEESE